MCVYSSEAGYDPQYGGRPIKRIIQKRVLNDLSKEILGNRVHKDSLIFLDVDDAGSLKFTNENIELKEI